MRIENVIEYVAVDGNRFKDETKCEKYEEELRLIKPIIDRLPINKIDSYKYIQHDKEFLLQIKRDLWDVVLLKYGNEYPKWKKYNADDVPPTSVVGRVLDDYGGPIAKLWSKLACFNFELGRQYEQQYFALNPDEALQEMSL